MRDAAFPELAATLLMQLALCLLPAVRGDFLDAGPSRQDVLHEVGSVARDVAFVVPLVLPLFAFEEGGGQLLQGEGLGSFRGKGNTAASGLAARLEIQRCSLAVKSLSICATRDAASRARDRRCRCPTSS